MVLEFSKAVSNWSEWLIRRMEEHFVLSGHKGIRYKCRLISYGRLSDVAFNTHSRVALLSGSLVMILV